MNVSALPYPVTDPFGECRLVYHPRRRIPLLEVDWPMGNVPVWAYLLVAATIVSLIGMGVVRLVVGRGKRPKGFVLTPVCGPDRPWWHLSAMSGIFRWLIELLQQFGDAVGNFVM
jgi:hypothetical protein